MPQEEKDRVVNTDRKIEEQSYKREPHERDESPDGQDIKPRGIMQQAAEDVKQGLVDTGNYGGRGTANMEEGRAPQAGATGQANPLEDRHRDMRDHDSVVPVDKGENR